MAPAIPFIVYGLMAASAAVAVTGSIQASNDAKRIGEANAQAEANNAAAAFNQSRVESAAIRNRNRRLRATQTMGYIRSGISLDGTASDVIYDSAIEGELEALSAEYRGDVAWFNSMQQSKIARMEGKSRSRQYKTQAVSQGLSAASSLSSGPKFS